MMDDDYWKAVAASLERGGSDLDLRLERNRERVAEDARRRAALPQWQPPPKPDYAARFAQNVFCEVRRKGRRR